MAASRAASTRWPGLTTRVPPAVREGATARCAGDAAAVGGVVLLMLAYSPTPVSMKFPLLVLGAAGLIAAGPLLTSLLSEVTPPQIRGSVFSVNGFCRLAVSALTPLAIGLVADRVTFVDRDVPVAVVDDQDVRDRADRYECEGGRILPGDEDDEGDEGS